jgi:Bacterial EndoU nuclease
LPAWSKLTFKLEEDGKTIHLINNHTVKGKGYQQSIAAGGRKDVFPTTMSENQIFKAVKEAYENSKKVGKTQIDPLTGEKRVELLGKSKDGMQIKIYVNTTLKILETAFPQ